MYYHVLIIINEDKKKISLLELDQENINSLKDNVLIPYVKGEGFLFEGYSISKNIIKRILVKQSEKPIKEIINAQRLSRDIANQKARSVMFITFDKYSAFGDENYMKDITKETVKEAQTLAGSEIFKVPLKPEEEGIMNEGLSFKSKIQEKAGSPVINNIHNSQVILGDVNNSTLTQNIDCSIKENDLDGLVNRNRWSSCN